MKKLNDYQRTMLIKLLQLGFEIEFNSYWQVQFEDFVQRFREIGDKPWVELDEAIELFIKTEFARGNKFLVK